MITTVLVSLGIVASPFVMLYFLRKQTQRMLDRRAGVSFPDEKE
jgi:hypothetical protein